MNPRVAERDTLDLAWGLETSSDTLLPTRLYLLQGYITLNPFKECHSLLTIQVSGLLGAILIQTTIPDFTPSFHFYPDLHLIVVLNSSLCLPASFIDNGSIQLPQQKYLLNMCVCTRCLLLEEPVECVGQYAVAMTKYLRK